MEESREEHWMDVAQDGKDKSNTPVLIQDVYTREKEVYKERIFRVRPAYEWGEPFLDSCEV